MVQFAWGWLFILLPVPFAIWKWMPKSESRHTSLRIPFFRQVTNRALTDSATSRTALIVAMAAWISLVAAVARPLWIEESVKIPVTGRDLLVALDISGSMETADFSNSRMTRFEAVQRIASEFIKRRIGDRVGLILFGSQPYLYAPLTFDVRTVADFLGDSRVGFAGKRTAIGDTIALAVKVLRERSAENRILILLTDGENSAGTLTPTKAMEIAVEYGVRIFVIGIGPDQSLKNADPSKNVLPQIAETSGGVYFHAASSEKLEQIYQEIDEFEPIETDERTFTKAYELYPWFLGLAMLMFGLLVLRNATVHLKWRSVSNTERSADAR